MIERCGQDEIRRELLPAQTGIVHRTEMVIAPQHQTIKRRRGNERQARTAYRRDAVAVKGLHRLQMDTHIIAIRQVKTEPDIGIDERRHHDLIGRIDDPGIFIAPAMVIPASIIDDAVMMHGHEGLLQAHWFSCFLIHRIQAVDIRYDQCRFHIKFLSVFIIAESR